MKICFYCRIEGKGYGFLLPDDADKLRKFFAEHQNKPALEKNQAQAKNFCRVLDIRVSEVVKSDLRNPCPFQYPFQHIVRSRAEDHYGESLQERIPTEDRA